MNVFRANYPDDFTSVGPSPSSGAARRNGLYDPRTTSSGRLENTNAGFFAEEPFLAPVQHWRSLHNFFVIL